MHLRPAGLLIAFAGAIALLGQATGLRAQTLPPPVPDASSFTFLSANLMDADVPDIFQSVQQFGPGSFSLYAPTLPLGSGAFTATANVVWGADPSFKHTTTETVLQDPGSQTAQSSTAMDYSFEVAGPSVIPVSVDFAGSIADSWSPNFTDGGLFDSAEVGIYDPNGILVQSWSISDQGGTSGGQTIDLNSVLNLSTDTVYTVALGDDAGIQLFFGSAPILDGTYSVSTSIDPSLAIDPDFHLPGYSLELSPNLAPVADAGSVLGLLGVAFVVLAAARVETRPGVRTGCA